MNDYDLLLHAKDYIDQLAIGINPLTGEPVGEGDVVREERIARCLAYVSGVMQNVLNLAKADAPQAPRRKGGKLWITDEQKSRFPYREEGMTLKRIAQELNALAVDTEARFTRMKFMDWLVQKGMLEIAEEDHKKRRIPTEQGTAQGFLWIAASGPRGSYSFILCNVEAQKYIIDNLGELLSDTPIFKNDFITPRQGKRWTEGEEAHLAELYALNHNLTIISRELGRTRQSVLRRLISLGLYEPKK